MSEHNHTGLDEAVSVASNTLQAVRTGKAISAAAKGAAAGGPYGAAIGAALSARTHIGKAVAAALVLLALPLLFILLLPGLAFGSLTDSGASGAAGQPILNNNAAITENMNQAAFAINQILGEGIENVKERIANDFAGTDGDHYEVVNPYEGDLISNANLFISQYCAAKNLDFAAISLTDMEQILRAGLTHLYSFSRTMEVRTVLLFIRVADSVCNHLFPLFHNVHDRAKQEFSENQIQNDQVDDRQYQIKIYSQHISLPAFPFF